MIRFRLSEGKSPDSKILKALLVSILFVGAVIPETVFYRGGSTPLLLSLSIGCILAASIFWGIGGGLALGLASTVVIGILVAMDKPSVLPQVVALCLVFYIGIGVLVGYLSRLVSTVRRQSAEIRRNSERLAAVNAAALDAIIQMDPDGKISYWNAAAERIFGYGSGEAVGRDLHSFLASPRFLPRFFEAFGPFRLNGTGATLGTTSEAEAVRKGGERFSIELSLSAFRLEEAWHAVGIVRDITDRKNAERKLREGEEALRRLFEQVPAGLYRTAPSGTILDANAAMVAMLGYTDKPSLLSANAADFYLDPGKRKEFEERMQRDGIVRNMEVALRRRDGSKIDVLLSSSAVWDTAGRMVFYEGSCLDITDRNTVKAQEAGMDRIRAVGQLAAGIAHDFNNLLAGILGYAELIRMKNPEDPDLSGYVEKIQTATRRGSNLTHGLLAFSNQQLLSLETKELSALILENAGRIRETAGNRIEVDFKRSEPGLFVRVDPAAIMDVALRIVANARDAMPDGGRLSVWIRMETLDSDATRSRGLPKAGSYACLSFQDSGTGMDAETLSRVFEPFFTTREFGGNAGLGLSVAYGIVRQLDGAIVIRSEPGKGTTAAVYLPAQVDVPPRAG